MQRYVYALTGLLCAGHACAATIIVAPGGPRETGAIVVSGILRPGDDEVFSKRLTEFPKGIVVLGGDGGDLQAAIKIGTAIRLKNYATLVSSHSSCVSACAIAWLGGAPRLMEDGSQIGFHAAYALKDGQVTEAGAPNALLGAYLNKIGLPDRAIAYITESSPDGMTWLNAADAAKMGIDFRTLVRPKADALAEAAPDISAPTASAVDQQDAAHPKKPSKAHARTKDREFRVSVWIARTLSGFGALHPTRLMALKDTGLRGR